MKKTPEDKALTKRAVSLRSKAYSARRKAFTEASEAAQASVNESEVGKAAQTADLEANACVAARNAELADIQRQIDALQAQLKQVQQKHDPLVEAARERRRVALSAKLQAQSAAREPIALAFADLNNVYSPAAWQPLDEFLTLAKLEPSGG